MLIAKSKKITLKGWVGLPGEITLKGSAKSEIFLGGEIL